MVIFVKSVNFPILDTLVLAIYFAANTITIALAGLALSWYVQSLQPVVDWEDPNGPGYRVLAVTPSYVEVQWIQLRLAVECPGHTEVTVLGNHLATAIEQYPFVIDNEPRTFVRRYAFPTGIPPGQYQVRVIDIAQCNPLFPHRQILRVPFEIKP